MFSFFFLVALLASLVAAAVVPRASQPATYDSTRLEPYNVYHARYTALSCQTQHNTQFFTDCCHPLLAGQQLSSRPARCNPNSSQQTSNSPPAHPPPAQAPPSQPHSDTSGLITGGVATFFFQNGHAGACGTVHSDSDHICAMDVARYGNTGVRSSLCGKSVRITNTKNNKSVTVVVADACPTCQNGNSIDLSQGAFEQIATLSEGEVPIAWEFV